MSYQGLLLEKENGVAVLTLNMPNKLNAIDLDMSESMSRALGDIGKDDDIRALIITGAGRAFSAGIDISALDPVSKMSPKEFYDLTSIFSVAIRDLKQPTIAAINGYVLGMSVGMALACDIRVASEDARFALANVKRAIVPDCGATHLVTRIVGTSKAFELMATGDTIDAREAERLGMVSRVVAAEELMPVAKDIAGRIAAGPSVAIGLMKDAVYKALDNTLEQQLEFEAFAQGVCFKTEDHQEGVRSFFEKRPPVFKGK